MANHSCRDEQPSPVNHHSIRVFTRPFLEYSSLYPSPAERDPAHQGAPPGIFRYQTKTSSIAGRCFRVAAMQHIYDKGGYASLQGMHLLELCAKLIPEEAIHIPVSNVPGEKLYPEEHRSACFAIKAPDCPLTGFVILGTELH